MVAKLATTPDRSDREGALPLLEPLIPTSLDVFFRSSKITQ
jgi:hypothetical protein